MGILLQMQGIADGGGLPVAIWVVIGLAGIGLLRWVVIQIATHFDGSINKVIARTDDLKKDIGYIKGEMIQIKVDTANMKETLNREVAIINSQYRDTRQIVDRNRNDVSDLRVGLARLEERKTEQHD